MFATPLEGFLTIGSSNSLTNLDILSALKIRNLDLYFKRRTISAAVLNFLQQMKDIEKLQLTGMPYRQLPVGSSTEWDNALSAGLSSLANLKIHYDIVDSFCVLWWSQYFPNLKKLYLINCQHTTNDLIWQLSSVASLTDLTLVDLNNLEDIAFTLPSRPRFVKDGDNSLIPAIACFNALKYLEIVTCPKLTDNCVINGIEQCKTLQKLTVTDCDAITKNCHEFVAFVQEFD